jgi:IclR family acetate operon transcriptional repressor
MQQPARRRGRPKGFTTGQSGPNIQALDRALDVLQTLAGHEGVTLTELSTYLGQSTATMHRVLSTLERRQFVEINSERQEWFIGPEAFRLGSAFLRRSNVVERSRPVMRDLMGETGETSNLGIAIDGDVLFVSQVETHESIRAFFPPGTRAPLHSSGIGKALLSTFSDERLGAFLKTARFDRFTDKTISSPQELREAIATTRERGYSFDDEERTVGMRCVAASILNVHGEAVAGISVSGPTHRMPDRKIHHIGHLVGAAADEVSRRIGAR